MSKRRVEVFSAGCPVCEDAVEMVQATACPSCKVEVRDMNDPVVATRARDLGIRAVPTVVLDGRVAECCGAEPDENVLRAAGLGQAL